jgi:phage/plasmid-associated DNA primase
MRELLDRTPDNRMRAIAEIDGKTFNLCSEMDVSDITKDSEAFKRLCSGEAHNARHLGHDIYKAENIPFLIFSMNHRPSNYKMDSAFRRRIVEIVFRACVKPEDMDTQLGARLRDELPGIRNWMIEGYKKLRADDFLFEHTNDEEYQESNEQYFDIFAKHEGLRPSAWAGHDEVVQLVGAHILLDRYTDFCKRKMINTDRCNDRAMGLDLKRLNFRKVRKASGVYYEVYCDRVLDYSVKV